MKQGYAKRILELADLLADRGRGYVKLLGGLRKT